MYVYFSTFIYLFIFVVVCVCVCVCSFLCSDSLLYTSFFFFLFYMVFIHVIVHDKDTEIDEPGIEESLGHNNEINDEVEELMDWVLSIWRRCTQQSIK